MSFLMSSSLKAQRQAKRELALRKKADTSRLKSVASISSSSSNSSVSVQSTNSFTDTNCFVNGSEDESSGADEENLSNSNGLAGMDLASLQTPSNTLSFEHGLTSDEYSSVAATLTECRALGIPTIWLTEVVACVVASDRDVKTSVDRLRGIALLRQHFGILELKEKTVLEYVVDGKVGGVYRPSGKDLMGRQIISMDIAERDLTSLPSDKEGLRMYMAAKVLMTKLTFTTVHAMREGICTVVYASKRQWKRKAVPSLALTQLEAKYCRDVLPIKVKCIAVVEPPMWARAIGIATKRVFRHKLLDRVVICSSHRKLYKYVALDQLPREFGGTFVAACCCKCSPTVAAKDSIVSEVLVTGVGSTAAAVAAVGAIGIAHVDVGTGVDAAAATTTDIEGVDIATLGTDVVDVGACAGAGAGVAFFTAVDGAGAVATASGDVAVSTAPTPDVCLTSNNGNGNDGCECDDAKSLGPWLDERRIELAKLEEGLRYTFAHLIGNIDIVVSE